MTITDQLKQEQSSDALHNRNCYAYLVQLKPYINDIILQLLPQFNEIKKQLNEEYNENVPYGDIYSANIADLEDLIDQSSTQVEAVDNLIQAIYHNDNHILEQANEKIVPSFKEYKKNVNQLSPEQAGNKFNRLNSLFSRNFKPQLETNLPSVKNYSYKKNTNIIEYRFSTQAQRHKGKTRVSPLFKRWLKIKAEQCPTEKTVSHIYFNNMAFDRSQLNIAGSKERELSKELHTLEDDPSLKVVVITLPASSGIMGSSSFQIIDDEYTYSSVYDELLAVAEGKKHKSGISDFIISEATRKLLFETDEHQSEKLKELLTNSFEKLGISPQDMLSTAQKQAVWLHFIKYELTNYIIETLKPNSFNFSCKDAIDRGAVSSAYYNLMKSFELNQAMQRNEFEVSLSQAATNVKGRDMNFHRHIIWNALNVYVNANYSSLLSDNSKSWLIYWRDINCPKVRVEELLRTRLAQSIDQFNSLPTDKMDMKQAGLKLLNSIKKHLAENTSDKKLLLKTVSITSELVSCASTASIEAYKDLANEIRINHPALHMIAGIMETLLGFILYPLSFGYSKSLINNGITMFNAGFYATERAELSEEILAFSNSVSLEK